MADDVLTAHRCPSPAPDEINAVLDHGLEAALVSGAHFLDTPAPSTAFPLGRAPPPAAQTRVRHVPFSFSWGLLPDIRLGVARKQDRNSTAPVDAASAPTEVPSIAPMRSSMCHSVSQMTLSPLLPLQRKDLEFAAGGKARGSRETSLESENGADFHLVFGAPGQKR